MERFKIRVNSPEHSEKIQKKLFEMGCGWGWEKEDDIRHKEKFYLYVGTEYENVLTYGNTEKGFNLNPLPEVELIEKISYEFREIPKKNVVKVGEFSYYEEDLAEALKNIKPI